MSSRARATRPFTAPEGAAHVTVMIVLDEDPKTRELESWLGQELTVQGQGETPWKETRTIARVQAQGRHVSITGEGASAALDGRPASHAWVNASPGDVAQDILDRAGVRSRRLAGTNAVTTPASYLVQRHSTDREFLDRLGRACGFVIIDSPEGDVAIAHDAPGRTHSLAGPHEIWRNVIRDFRLPACARAEAIFEEDGQFYAP